MFIRCEFEGYSENEEKISFQPGCIVYVEDLMKNNVNVKAMLNIPLSALIMCVRDKQLNTFGVEMIKKYEDRFSSLAFVFHETWADGLTAEACEFLNLNIDVLIEDGLNKKLIKQLKWPLSKWVEYLKMDSNHINRLKIENPRNYFSNLSEDIVGMGKMLSQTNLFDIEI